MKKHSWDPFKKTIFGIALLPALFAGAARAQDSLPYLKSATFYIACDGWVDIWLNGIPIVESQRSTPDSATYQRRACLPGHLCYFRNENVLAFENSNAYRSQAPLKNQIGFAYVLKLRFSDGTETALSSNENSAHKAYYLPGMETGEPRDWHHASFNDVNWSTPYAIGMAIPGVAQLSDPENGQGIQFFSASGPSFKSRFEGERHLYRREFYLDIGPNPNCSPFEVHLVKRTAPTQTPKPIMVRPTPAVSRPVYAPIPTPTWAPVPIPTALPTVVPKQVIYPHMTLPVFFTPTPKVPKRTRLRKPTPTPAPDFSGPGRVEPIEAVAPLVPTRTETPVPSIMPPPSPVHAQAQTIVFNAQPANIYISYADGPGVYRLEVVDPSFHHLRALFEKRVVARADDWVEWDGKDDAGREVPAGQYTVLYTKDGKELNRLVLVKTDDH